MLEQVIQENTAAIRALTAALAARSEAPVVAPVPARTAPPPPQSTPAPAAVSVQYDKDVKPLALKLAATKGKEALVAVLKGFGVERAPDVPVDRHPDLVSALKAAL